MYTFGENYTSQIIPIFIVYNKAHVLGAESVAPLQNNDKYELQNSFINRR